MAQIILQQILVMALYMIVGYVLYRTGKITDAGSKTLANMLAFAVIPFMLVNSFLVEFSAEKLANFGLSFLIGTGTVVVSLLISSLIFRRSAIERFAAAFSNCGFIGIPLIRASIGDEGVFFLVGLLIPFNVIQWVYGAPMLVREAQGGEKAPSRGCADILKHVIWNPMVIASCIGVLLFVTGLGTRVPLILTSCISGVASLNSPLAMIVLGVYLAQFDLKELFLNKRLYLVSAVRLILIPVILMLILAVIPVDNRIKMTMLIAGAAPVGANVAVYCQIYGADYVYACKTVAHSTVLSIVIMPAVIFLAERLMPVLP